LQKTNFIFVNVDGVIQKMIVQAIDDDGVLQKILRFKTYRIYQTIVYAIDDDNSFIFPLQIA